MLSASVRPPPFVLLHCFARSGLLCCHLSLCPHRNCAAHICGHRGCPPALLCMHDAGSAHSLVWLYVMLRPTACSASAHGAPSSSIWCLRTPAAAAAASQTDACGLCGEGLIDIFPGQHTLASLGARWNFMQGSAQQPIIMTGITRCMQAGYTAAQQVCPALERFLHS